MGILYSLNPNPRLANAHSMLTYGTRGATTRDTITPPVDSGRLHALNVLIRPEARVLLVNALLSAILWMTNNEAMTCPIHRHIRRPFRRLGSRKSTNLSPRKGGYKDVQSSTSGTH